MIALVRKNLGCLILQQRSPLLKSHGPFSLSFRNCSIPAQREEAVDAVRDLLVKKHHFDPKLAADVTSQLGRSKSRERADSILSSLQQNCFSTIQLQRIVKYSPRILTASVEDDEDDVTVKIKLFKDFGFSAKEIPMIITGNLSILDSSAEKKLVPQLSALKSLIGSNDEVVTLLKREGRFMTVDLEKTLMPNLRSSGVDEESIRKFVLYCPRSLLVKPDAMKKAVEKLNEFGMDSSTKGFLSLVGDVSRMTEKMWELKLQGFKDMGFSESQILQTFRAAPSVLSVSMEKINQIKNLLIATGKFDVSDMVKESATFLCSVEMKYKPRIRVLEILESKKLIRRWPSLFTICRMSHDKFLRNLYGLIQIILVKNVFQRFV